MMQERENMEATQHIVERLADYVGQIQDDNISKTFKKYNDNMLQKVANE